MSAHNKKGIPMAHGVLCVL